MNINYEYYRIFYYVAKYRNLTTAAKVLHSNQPNLSRTIKLLENELNCQLFIRSNRGISLTPEGERLYSHVKIAVEQLQNAEEELEMITGLQKGMITIGASETALRLLILPVLSQFKKDYPDIRIRIQNHLTRQAIDSVRQGIVDFSVVAASPTEFSVPLKYNSLMQFQDILIGGNDFAGLEDFSISLKELENYPLISLSEHTMTYQFYDSFYRLNQLLLKPELEAATTEQILLMIKNNLGIGFIPEVFAKEALEAGDVHRISLLETLPCREIYLVENEKRPLSITARALKDLLMQYPLSKV